VRIVASTKYDLKNLIAEGRFRDDLYYRLNVIPMHIPPLRERREDIPILMNRFLNDFENGRHLKMDDEALGILKQYNWPGNVRELRNLIERLVLTCPGDTIAARQIPAEFFLSGELPDIASVAPDQWDLEKVLAETEIKLIRAAIVRSGGNKTKASRLLNIPLSTFRTKADKYGIE
jgi:DNA-binding NtrC family response regulator